MGPDSTRLIGQTLRANEMAISAFSFWEIAMLREKGRMTLLRDIGSWRMDLLREGLIEIPVDGATSASAPMS